LAVTVLYELPFFQHSGDEAEKLTLGGWRFNVISTFRSGGSITPGLSESNQGLSARPDQAANTSTNGPKLWKNAATAQWFNTTAFKDPAYGYYGNAQNGIIRGPGSEVWNLSLFKEFHFWENNMLEFRAESFNLFNHTNPSNPNATLGNSNYGKVTSAADPRILELALRYKF
jgi:hypothetical protein